MASEQRILVPLIIDGVDVILPDEQNTFTPQSAVNDGAVHRRVIAQGTDIEHCHAAVDSSARAFKTLSQTSTTYRRHLLFGLAQLLRSRGEEISAIVQEEIHATPLWSKINLEDSNLMIEEAASLVTSPILSGNLPTSQNPDSQVLVLTEPLGVILGIAPWNSPLILGFRSVLPAIAAGNTAILKGSELSPRIHYSIASLFREAGFPPGVCNFLLHREEDASQVVETIIERHEVRKCNFTGSTPVGRIIASKAALALKPCLMELGGKNYVLILEDADVEKAAMMVAEGAFLNNGQICMSTDTVLVAISLYLESRKMLLAVLRSPDLLPQITRMITTKATTRVRSLITDALQHGATIHISSQDSTDTTEDGDSGHKVNHELESRDSVPATVIEGVNSKMRVYTEESFGPLVSIKAVEGDDEAVGIVNECRYGLSAAIHTRNHYKALYLAKRLRVGAIHINGSTVHDESTLPHGGYGDSGWGRFGAG
ncbi:putative aldehyde dehydrogenase [Halenospora varia]|nr:putative aldehyde dehydrogenase [Halenospora varia]